MEYILIVDDDENLCSVLSEELTEIGYFTSFTPTLLIGTLR